MKNILSYILILFLFASSTSAMNFTEELVEVIDDVELIEAELEGEKDEAILSEKEIIFYSNVYSSKSTLIIIQIQKHEFVFCQALNTPLYILFDSFLI
jgi:hypothetical protein